MARHHRSEFLRPRVLVRQTTTCSEGHPATRNIVLSETQELASPRRGPLGFPVRSSEALVAGQDPQRSFWNDAKSPYRSSKPTRVSKIG